MSRSLKVGVTVSLATAAMLYGAIEHGRRMRADLPLRELPSTARAVLRVDTSALQRTPAAEALFARFVGRERLTEIQKACGIDPLEALSDVVVWVQGPDDQPLQSVGLMLRGRTVDASRLAECHRTLVEARGGSVIRFDAPMGALLVSRDRRSAIARLDDRTVVAGSVQTVAETMEVARGIAPPLRDRTAIASLWTRLGRDAAVVAVLEPPAHWREALQGLAQEDDRPTLQGLGALGFSISAGSRETAEAEIDFIASEAARRSVKPIERWLHEPPESIGDPWSGVVRSARVRAMGRTIRISFDLSALAESG